MTDNIQYHELMRRISKGDEKAFEQLFKAYYARLVVFARKYIIDRDLAENVVQSVFVKMWERRESVQIAKPGAYLLIAVRNHCLNELKQQKILVWAEEKQGAIINLPDEDLPDESLAEKVQSVIAEMPPQRQKIFRLNRFEGMKYKDIALKLGLSHKTIEAQMGKALQFLREKLPSVIESQGFS